LLVDNILVRAALLLLLVGCSAQLGAGGGSSTTGDDDSELAPDAAVILPDASPDATPVAADNACLVASDFGALGDVRGTAVSELQDSTSTLRVSWVEAPTPSSSTQDAPDVLVVEMWDDFGVFTGTVAKPGTFQITGDETDYDTCGVCVLLLANNVNDTPAKMLLATSGTVTVTSVATAAGQTTQVSLTNASFVEISYDATNGYQTVATSTCPSPIDSVGLTGTI
jgi:hypothetical protein